jgi:hypothetical protein
MKKIFTILVAIATVSIASAQGYHDNDHSYSRQNYPSDHRYDNGAYDRRDDGGYDHHDQGGYDRRDNSVRYDQHRNDDWQRQEQINRINDEYNRQVDVCRDDYSISRRERNRRIYRINAERYHQLRSFGSFAPGAVAGAAAGFVLGSILSH